MSIVYTPPVKAEREYLERMRKSFPDKAWFVPLLKSQHDIKSIVDFGCADGSFIKFLEKRLLNVRPDIVPRIIGVEEQRTFLKMCYDNDVLVVDDIQKVTNFFNPSESLLVFNSVLHEVAHYGNLAFLLYQARSLGFRAIAIRDMRVGGRIWQYDADMEKRFRSCVPKVWMPGGVGQIPERLNDFEKHWGSIADGYKVVHFLLKYFYEENWDRELPENYLSVDWKWLYGEIRNMGGDVTYMKNYCLPYLLRKWRTDFGDQRLYDWFGLIKTHVKMFVTFPQEN